MIVDVRSRVWESAEQLGRMAEALRRRPADPWNRPAASPEEHAQAMRPVAEAFVHGFESQLVEASIPKEKVAEYVAAYPQKLMGFAGIDPTAGKPTEQLEEALALGLVGVTVSPVAQGFHPADTRAMALFEACADKGVPVFVETGVAMAREAPLEFGQPHLLDEVARTFPELRMVLSALGHPWIEQGLALVGKHPTMFGEFSDLILRPWQLYNALALAHQQGVMSQLLFGSGFPFCKPERAIVTVYSVNTLVQGTHLPTIPREQLRSVVERDAIKCLGLTRRNEPASASTGPNPSQQPAGRSEAPSPRQADRYSDTSQQQPHVVEDAAQ